MDEQTLEACPFCGGKPFGWHDEWDFAVECEDCGNRTSMHQDENVVIERWNRRAGKVAELTEALENIAGAVDANDGIAAMLRETARNVLTRKP